MIALTMVLEERIRIVLTVSYKKVMTKLNVILQPSLPVDPSEKYLASVKYYY